MRFKKRRDAINASNFIFSGIVLLLALCSNQSASAQNFRSTTGGEIRSLSDREISVRDSKSKKKKTFFIQLENSDSSRFPTDTKFSISGTIPVKLLQAGSTVEFSVPINSSGRSKNRVDLIKVIEADESKHKVEPEKEPEPGEYVSATIIGTVTQVTKGRVKVSVPKSDYARSGKLSVLLAKDAKLEISSGNYDMVMVGDTIKSAKAAGLTNGAFYASELEIELTADREKELSFDEQLERQFSSLSDDPGEPRDVRSANFILHTDVSEKSATILLAKLERMYGLIFGYFGKRPPQPIECYVVRPSNLKAWADRFDSSAAAKIAEPAGVTQSRSLGRKRVATVYSCDDHGVVQHEAVHAFCFMAFGSTGPVWYSEGMAEMGQYWRDGQLEVNISRGVINYLTNAEPKKMKDIVAAGQITGDSWQAYAWRWALCHLLANNPNYAKRFKRLGMTLMAKGPDSFDNAFGPVAPHISFEYDQFVENFGNGYRVDLCVWDWRTKAKKLGSSSKARTNIEAAGGWQSTKVELVAGTSYDFVAEGEWSLDSSPPTDADGSESGAGRLVGVIYKDFALSKPFDLGTKGTFVAPSEGHLYVRCNDEWTDLGNNEGAVKLDIRKTAAEKK